mmetsp:Transcript_69441/g.224583  ORF Transcript_69441/g.224583 Transcript_69441/m.224583 type:complete len:268 (+) Transcript_69441:573-1376(+)
MGRAQPSSFPTCPQRSQAATRPLGRTWHWLHATAQHRRGLRYREASSTKDARRKQTASLALSALLRDRTPRTGSCSRSPLLACPRHPWTCRHRRSLQRCSGSCRSYRSSSGWIGSAWRSGRLSFNRPSLPWAATWKGCWQRSRSGKEGAAAASGACGPLRRSWLRNCRPAGPGRRPSIGATASSPRSWRPSASWRCVSCASGGRPRTSSSPVCASWPAAWTACELRQERCASARGGVRRPALCRPRTARTCSTSLRTSPVSAHCRLR